MSPLGSLSVFSQLQHPRPLQLQFPAFGLLSSLNLESTQPLATFMSVSLGGRRDPLRRRPAEPRSRSDMTLYNDSGNGNFSSKMLLHGIRNFIPTEEGGGVSISSPVATQSQNDADETDAEIDVDDSMSTVTMTTASHSPSPSSSHSVRSSTPTETGTRNRHYSSEDSASFKSLPGPYNPLSSLSDALIGGNAFQQEQQRHHQASLLFSIANILRPDFGLGRLPLPSQSGSVPPPPPPLNFHFNNSHPVPVSKPKRKFTDSHSDHHLPKRLKPEHVIPIDLSRPPPHDEGSKATSRKQSHHRRIPQQWSPPFPQLPGSVTSKTKSNEEKSADGKGSTSPVTSSDPGVKLGSKGQSDDTTKPAGSEDAGGEPNWPAWVYCTRYSDRPSSGRSPRARRTRKQKEKEVDEKRPRTAFTADQLSRLKTEFEQNKYLTEKRRQDLANDLQLHENQIKIWFQNKRAKLKKSSGQRGRLAEQLRAQGLYNHSTIQSRGCGDDDDEDSD